jgi:hypothetical protein
MSAPKHTPGPLSLWHVHSNGKDAYVVGTFGENGDPDHRGFRAVCASWPEWAGQGSGNCLAGSAAFQPRDRETPVLVPLLTELADVLEEVWRSIDWSGRSQLEDEIIRVLAKAGRLS